MLSQIEQEQKDDIACWNPDGRTFRVYNIDKFEKEIMPRFFAKQHRYRSFQRQLNFYGFQRIGYGILEGSYGHPLFIRGNEDLCRQIKRLIKTDHKPSTSGTTTRSIIDTGIVITPAMLSQLDQLQQSKEEEIEVLEPLPFHVRNEQQPASRRRSTLILMDRLRFVADSFFDDETDRDQDENHQHGISLGAPQEKELYTPCQRRSALICMDDLQAFAVSYKDDHDGDNFEW
jgi:hypothetical protein